MESKEINSKNKMATVPPQKLILSMGLPVVISMVMQATYNIVDSIFIARMSDEAVANAGELAINALTLAFPIQMLFVAFGIGTGVGVGALISRKLGEKNIKIASKAAGNGIFLGLVGFLVFFIFGLFGIDAYLKSQTNDEIIFAYGKTYLTICTLLSFGNILFAIFEKALQSTGKTIYSTIAQLAGAITNIILDPILIYGLLGFPKMGVAGAAIATVIGQIVNLILGLYFQIAKNKELPIKISDLKPDVTIIKQIYSIGISAIIMQALMSFMTYGVNVIFGLVSTNAVSAYGIYYKVQQFIFFAAFGIRDTITPVVAFNYGAGLSKRVKQSIKYGVIYTLAIMIIGILILQIFAAPLSEAFGLTTHTMDLCIMAMRVCSLGFIFAGINIALQGVFQALENGNASLIVSFLRLLVIPLPLALLFTNFANAESLIWFSFPIAELAASIVSALLMKKTSKKVFGKLKKAA